jgi:membrane protease YdiL (CAAX protease family)
MLALLLGLAWLAGRDVYSLFSFNAIGLSEVGVGALALGVSLGLRKLSDVLWTPEERRRLIVRAMLPRTPGEWALYVAMAVLAGIAEEAAYRGVGMYVLRETIGNPWVAALILSTAFALAHLVQEWKAVALVFVMAVLMHALVELTGTLVVAMVVHAVFDIISGVLGACEAREESSTPASGFRAAG